MSIRMRFVAPVLLVASACGAFAYQDMRIGNEFVRGDAANYALVEKSAQADGWTVAPATNGYDALVANKGDKRLVFATNATNGHMGYKCEGLDGDECRDAVEKILKGTR